MTNNNTTHMRVLKLASETLPKCHVQIDGDVLRLEGDLKLYRVNKLGAGGMVIESNVLQIISEHNSLYVADEATCKTVRKMLTSNLD